MIRTILNETFGHNKFRDHQRKIIDSILSGHNTLVVMSTGSGKSLCYQLPAVAQEGMAIVISPLIALMKNQVDTLNAKHINAACLNSSIPKKTLEKIKEDIKAHKIKLLYVAPETLNKEKTIELLQSTKISFIAVDEAHCISDWGHDFRPEYRNTRKAIKALGSPPIIALTATATPKVQHDILRSLDIEDSIILTSTFHRKNLYYQILPKRDTERQIISFIKTNTGEAGIIYCHSRKKSEELAELLQLNNINAVLYHAGLDTKTREENQDRFIKNEVDVIVATIAFGMGIDKPNVRFVIHYDPPKSLENYYQETGRAGRDGKASKCIFFYDHTDIEKLLKLSRNKPAAERETAKRLIDAVVTYAHSALCRTQQLLHYFGEAYEGKCEHCDNCQEERKTYEAMIPVTILLELVQQSHQKYSPQDLIKILLGSEEDHLSLTDAAKLPNFGKGQQYTYQQWISIVNQLLIAKYLHIENTDTDIVQLTPKGKKFIKAPHTIKLLEDLSFSRIEAGKESSNPSKEVLDSNLLEALIKLRDTVALKEGFKPYLVFQEKALKAMATYYPTTIEQLGKISHVSISKAHKFGEEFIKLIQQHVQDHTIERPTHIVVKATTAKSSKKIHLIQQIDRKTNLKHVAKQNGMDYETLIKVLEEICQSGIKLNLDYYINEVIDQDSREELYAYFEEAEEDNVEQAIEDLEDEFPEEEIRLMHIKFLSEVAY